MAFTADGWLHTGDLGYRDADDWLFITGRSKEVINRGGEIISPLEVEQALQKHPAIGDCVVFALPDQTLGEAVAACVVARLNRRALHGARDCFHLCDRISKERSSSCAHPSDMRQRQQTQVS